MNGRKLLGGGKWRWRWAMGHVDITIGLNVIKVEISIGGLRMRLRSRSIHCCLSTIESISGGRDQRQQQHREQVE